MTTTFGGTLLPNASKIKAQSVIAIKDTLLLSGKHRIQSSTNAGFEATFDCFGTWAEYEAVLALIGASNTLITPQEPSGYGTCKISSIDGPKESDNPGYYYFTVSFKRDTTS